MSFFKRLKKIISKKNESYEKGLTKTRNAFISELSVLNEKYKNISDNYFDELEEILVMADIGVNVVISFIDRLKYRVKKENINNPNSLTEIIIDELFIVYVDDDILSSKINYNNNGPTVLLFIGVNGSGKTTSIAKIAYKYMNSFKKVLLIAGDTFRAGAIEQLKEWGNKINCDVFSKESSSDPSSVIYDGLTKALDEKYDMILIDTAGRLQNKVNLMKELAKINRVIGKLIPNAPHETLLVIDANTGQNGISQAKSFMEITNITGIILTKLDGTAKGGIVLAIKESVNIPVKYVGLGEKISDLEPFDLEKYIYGLFKDLLNK